MIFMRQDKGMTEPTSPTPPELPEDAGNSSTTPKRVQYQDGIEPTILSSTTTARGTVFNEIKAGSRPSRIVMRQDSVVDEPDPERPDPAKKSCC
jgi:hypothetical protein